MKVETTFHREYGSFVRDTGVGETPTPTSAHMRGEDAEQGFLCQSRHRSRRPLNPTASHRLERGAFYDCPCLKEFIFQMKTHAPHGEIERYREDMRLLLIVLLIAPMVRAQDNSKSPPSGTPCANPEMQEQINRLQQLVQQLQSRVEALEKEHGNRRPHVPSYRRVSESRIRCNARVALYSIPHLPPLQTTSQLRPPHAAAAATASTAKTQPHGRFRVFLTEQH